MEIERKIYFGSHQTMNDIIKDKEILEIDIFKIALKKYIDDLEAETPVKSFFESININNIIALIISIVLILGFAKVFM